MLQIVMRDGRPQLVDVPAPSPVAGSALVANLASVISSGTERAAVRSGGSIAQRAMKNPDLVRQTLRHARERGLQATRDLVRGAIADDLPLGYSSAGVVLDTGGIAGLTRGALVACAGAGKANHAETVSVPANLLVVVPEGVDARHAAFTTIGAIALQGIRRAKPELGERFAVVGLGLLGLLTVQLLRAAGCEVIGVEPVERRRELAGQFGATFLNPGDLDGVIVTASSSDPTLINEAVAMTRRKGRVVMVGDATMAIERGPLYEREADLLISTSYGPGRYDELYEDLGVDYPIAYVRWTENRNMAAFLELVRSGAVQLDSLVDLEVPVERAMTAYEAIAGDDPPLAAVLSYSVPTAPPSRDVVRVSPRTRDSGGVVRTALVGAGSFVKAVHVPNLLAHSDISVNLVVARRGAGATSVAKRFAGASAATDWRVAIDDPRIDLVFIGTRHDSHAEIAAAALDAGKLVFVEKPLGITREQLDLVWLAGGSNRQLIVGFNRRFATLGKRLIDAVSRLNSPIHVVYRVSAPLPSDHWLSDPDQGGGRVLGEMCHMFDFCNALCGTPSEVAAAALPSPVGAPSVETLNATVRFENGSVATIAYSGVGSSAMPKERVEVFCGGTSFVLDDFRSLTTFQGREILVEELKRSERGHRELLAHALDAFRGAASMQPGISAGYIAESVALATLESVADGKFIPVLTMPVLG